MFNKKGQVYLIATVIIISIISGFMFLSEYSKKESSNFVYDLKKQLETESEMVLDYGFANEEDIDSLVEVFTEDFSNYAGAGVGIYFVTGQEGNMNVYYYEDGKQIVSSSEEGGVISFVVENITYNCELNDGENFYFVIAQTAGDEKYITNSEGCVGVGVGSSISSSGGGCTPDCSGVIDSFTKLLLHMNDVGLTDEIEHDVILNGGVSRSATESQFGGYSAYFDGAGDYLSIDDSADWDFGADDFTIDCWINTPDWDGNGYGVMMARKESTTERWDFSLTDAYGVGDKIRFHAHIGGVGKDFISGAPGWSANTWHHIALVRKDGAFKMYGDGQDLGVYTDSFSTDDNLNQDAAITIGSGITTYYYIGYIDELRISKGVARWTENFADELPDAPYPLDKECGDDGCSPYDVTDCGDCDTGYVCESGSCVAE